MRRPRVHAGRQTRPDLRMAYLNTPIQADLGARASASPGGRSVISTMLTSKSRREPSSMRRAFIRTRIGAPSLRLKGTSRLVMTSPASSRLMRASRSAGYQRNATGDHAFEETAVALLGGPTGLFGLA